MIDALFRALPGTVTAADVVARSDDTLTATADSGGDAEIVADQSAGLSLRVHEHGRVGWAGGPADPVDTVVRQALTAARCGPALDLMLPMPAPLPRVETAAPDTGGAGPAPVLALARSLAARLARPDRRVEAWAERSAGTVQVANSRGVRAEYAQTLAGAGVSVASLETPAGAPLRLHLAGTALPGEDALDALAREAERWLAVPVVDEWPRTRSARVWFRPAAVRVLLAPILAGLTGDAWADPSGERPALDPALTLIDDPLAGGRPGSRPVCDDGVPCRAMTLVAAGRPVQGILDLQTGARHGLPATGHGRRRTLGAPRPAFSNLRLVPGRDDAEALARAVGDGFLVLALTWGPAPNVAGGMLRTRAPWTFLIRHGTLAGRVAGAVVAGDVLRMFRNVGAIGADAGWAGAWAVPSLVLDEVSVTTG